MLARKAKQADGQSGGQTVDVSIYERYVGICIALNASDIFIASMINLMEGIIPEYTRKGKVTHELPPSHMKFAVLTSYV